jgi:hypothetical protein
MKIFLFFLDFGKNMVRFSFDVEKQIDIYHRAHREHGDNLIKKTM